MDDASAERLAANEARFREINERLESDVADLVEGDERIAFVCECSDTNCRASVELTLAEYAYVRESDQRFALRPGHQLPEIEHVVSEHGDFLVVEKHRGTDVTATGR